METARPFAPETRSRDRLWFGFRPDKPGKRPGFTDSTGEYRDTRTGWLGELDSNRRDAVDRLNMGASERRFSAAHGKMPLRIPKVYPFVNRGLRNLVKITTITREGVAFGR